VEHVLKYPDPKLRAPNARIDDFGPRLKQLAAEMFDVMYSCAAQTLDECQYTLLQWVMDDGPVVRPDH
jgi:peptide deformylase